MCISPEHWDRAGTAKEFKGCLQRSPLDLHYTSENGRLSGGHCWEEVGLWPTENSSALWHPWVHVTLVWAIICLLECFRHSYRAGRLRKKGRKEGKEARTGGKEEGRKEGKGRRMKEIKDFLLSKEKDR